MIFSRDCGWLMDVGVVYDMDFVIVINVDISMLFDIDGLNWMFFVIMLCLYGVIYNLIKIIWVWCDILVLLENINKLIKY